MEKFSINQNCQQSITLRCCDHPSFIPHFADKNEIKNQLSTGVLFPLPPDGNLLVLTIPPLDEATNHSVDLREASAAEVVTAALLIFPAAVAAAARASTDRLRTGLLHTHVPHTRRSVAQ